MKKKLKKLCPHFKECAMRHECKLKKIYWTCNEFNSKVNKENKK